MPAVHPHLDLRALGAFVQAARMQSFTLAADRLGMTPSAVSKALTRLEDDLGTVLLNRSPRAVSLTADGARFLVEAERVLVAVERARGAATERQATERRRLTVALPIHFGRIEIAPQLPLFVTRHPDVDLEYLLVRNGRVDFAERLIDIALRVGGSQAPHSRMMSEKVAFFHSVLTASPAYIDRFGRPDDIEALAGHRTMGGIDEETGAAMPWSLRIGGRAIEHLPRFNLASNSIEVLLELALAGGGIVPLPHYLAADPIRLGQLQPILTAYRMEPVPVQITYARARAQDPEVIDFVAMLAEVISQRRPVGGRGPRSQGG